jgi:hypothetical protein
MKRWLTVVGVIAVLGLAWLASVLSSTEVTQLPNLPRGPESLSPTPERSQQPPPGQGHEAAGHFPVWILWIVGGVMAAFIAAVIIALLWMLIRSISPVKKERLLVRKTGGKALNERHDEEVLAAVEAGLEELSDSDTDPRRAVIACWVRLEGAAAVAGTPREPGDSPTDLVVRLLSAHQVSRAVLESLAGLYLEARYATHPIGEHERQTALGALRRLRAELGAVATW